MKAGATATTIKAKAMKVAAKAPTIKAKARQPLKRPAAQPGSGEYVPYRKIAWAAADKDRNRNTFTCLHYSRAMSAMRVAGWKNKRDIQDELKLVLALAGEAYDNR